MAALKLRGQSLSVLISALYLTDGDPDIEVELARENVLERQILLQGTDGLSSLMWKAIQPLLTQEWDACLVNFGGAVRRMPGRVALLDSTQAWIEVEERRSVRLVEAASWLDDPSALRLPDLEDQRIEAKIVSADSLPDLREPVAADVGNDDLVGIYSKYIPLGGSKTMFTSHRIEGAINERGIESLAKQSLDRLKQLESFLLNEL